jgi:hypothetical protein
MKQTKKLSQSGSFFNYLMSNNSSVPVVGKGATIMLYTDRKVAEVVEVSEDGKRVVIEHLNAKNKGQFGEQNWEFSPSGNKETIVWRNNAWRREYIQIEFTEEMKQLSMDNGYSVLVCKYLEDNNPELSEEIYQGQAFPQKVIKGITKAHKMYPKINILFGAKNYYYDYSF